ncbi:TolC family protein [Deferribacteraceae bacterium V6Fe1]|nr:TolC family protein [Deferribacteraceae bacterium V6Fe1]
MKKILLMLLISSNIFALNIDEAVQNALQNNHILKFYESSVKSSKFDTESSKSLQMPSFFLDSSYTLLDEEKKLNVEIAPGLTSSMTQVKGNYFDATVGIKYNIYTGGAVSSNIKINRHKEESIKQNYFEFKNELIFQVKKQYTEILKLLAQKEIAQRHLDALNSHYSDVQNFYKQGIVAELDLLQTDVKLKEAKQSLTKVDNYIKVAKSALSLLINSDVENSEFSLEELSQNIIDKTINIDTLYEKAVKNRPIIKQIESEISALSESKKTIKSDYLPKIYAAGGYTYNNQNDEISPKGGFFGKVGIQMNIDWDYPTKKLKSVNEKLIALNQQRLNTILKVKLEVKEAYEMFQTALLNLEVAKSAVDEANEYNRIIKLKYDNGLASNSDVLDGQALLTTALSNEKNAYYELFIAYFQIEKTIGKNLR